MALSLSFEPEMKRANASLVKKEFFFAKVAQG
jgi:hypothetical protein